MTDKNAEACAKELYSYLENVPKSGRLLFGHQNDQHCKAGARGKGFTASDVEDVCGHAAAVMGLDVLSLTGMELGDASWSRERLLGEAVRLCENAFAKGAAISLSAHMPNFELLYQNHSADYSGYTPNDLRGRVARDVLQGGHLNSIFNGYLDLVADFLKVLSNRGIPVIWRPFHENTGGWFWWGCDTTSPQEFKDLWAYTWNYLTNERSVHNVIWAYSLGSEPKSKSDFLERYPGDAFVDLIGLDMYQNYSLNPEAFWSEFDFQLGLSAEFAREHNKLFANTETGIMRPNNKALLTEGNEKGWYKRVAELCLKHRASYFLLWANFSAEGAFYTPYVLKRELGEDGNPAKLEGHELISDFRDFCKDERIIFAQARL